MDNVSVITHTPSDRERLVIVEQEEVLDPSIGAIFSQAGPSDNRATDISCQKACMGQSPFSVVIILQVWSRNRVHAIITLVWLDSLMCFICYTKMNNSSNFTFEILTLVASKKVDEDLMYIRAELKIRH